MGLFTSKAEKLYRKGRDALRRFHSPDTAMAYFHEAAALGHDGAGLLLGDCYRKGDLGLPQDGNKALENYALVREPIGRFGEGLVYYFGTKGVERDDAKALALFQEAYHAKKYYVLEAKGFLGAMYFWGRGVEQDDEKAAELLSDFMTFDPQHYPDAEYCYYCLRYYGRGGLGCSPQLAIENLPRIKRYAQSQEVRDAAQHLIWEEQARQASRTARKPLPPEFPEIEPDFQSDAVAAACLLAQVHLRSDRTGAQADAQRRQALTAVLKSVQNCGPSGRQRVASLLDQYRSELERRDPDLYAALEQAIGE